jgi:signal transduction histidine kinase
LPAPRPRFVRERILAFAAALALAVATLAPGLYEWLLDLSPAQVHYVRGAFLVLVPLVVVALGLTLAIGLLGVEHAPRSDSAARRRVLRLPAYLAFVTVGAGTAANVVGMVVNRFMLPTPMSLIVGIGLCTSALIGLCALPLYAFARHALLPLAVEFADESLPTGRPLSLSVTLGYTIMAVASAALVPAAVVGAAQLDAANFVATRNRAIATGRRLAASADQLDLESATTLLVHTPLSGGERAVLRTPSGALIPEDVANEVDWLPYVEIPLSGELKGGALRVIYARNPASRAPLFGVTLTLLLLTWIVGRSVGRAVAKDTRGVAGQIARLSEGEEAGAIGAIFTTEVRRLTMAVNRLLERIPRLTVESFLAVERAEEARRMKSQFLANMSHDLRAPLNSILGFSELLLRGLEGTISESQRDVVNALHATGQSLLRLLTEILDTAKVESGKMELQLQPSLLAELVNQAVQEARRGRAPSAGDRLKIELQAGMPQLRVDPLRITQAVAHLLNYALDAAQGGDVTLRARDGELGDTRLFVLEVEHEHGHACARDPRLFEGFRKVPGAEGLHLALPLSKRLFELHGGTMETLVQGKGGIRVVMPLSKVIGRTTPTKGVPRIVAPQR